MEGGAGNGHARHFIITVGGTMVLWEVAIASLTLWGRQAGT